MSSGTRDLHIDFIFFRQRQIDYDVVFDTPKVPHLDLDVGIFLGFGVDDEGSIDEFQLLRASTPLLKGDKVVYIPPTPTVGDRRVQERTAGTEGNIPGADTYIGDVQVRPGTKGKKGITKKLLLRGPSGMASLEIPDTPVPDDYPQEYDGSLIFEIGGKSPGSSVASSLSPNNLVVTDLGTEAIVIEAVDLNKWADRKRAEFLVKYNPREVYIEAVTITSENLSIFSPTIKGIEHYPGTGETLKGSVEWAFLADLDKEKAKVFSSLDISVSFRNTKLGSVQYNFKDHFKLGFGEGNSERLYELPSSEVHLVPGVLVGKASNIKTVMGDFSFSDGVSNMLPLVIQTDLSGRPEIHSPVPVAELMIGGVTSERVGEVYGKIPGLMMAGIFGKKSLALTSRNIDEPIHGVLNNIIRIGRTEFSGMVSWTS